MPHNPGRELLEAAMLHAMDHMACIAYDMVGCGDAECIKDDIALASRRLQEFAIARCKLTKGEKLTPNDRNGFFPNLDFEPYKRILS